MNKGAFQGEGTAPLKAQVWVRGTSVLLILYVGAGVDREEETKAG